MNGTEDILNNFTTSNIYFSWFDYAYFGIMLGVSVVIGIYFGFFKGQSSAHEYLLGGKEMNPIAVGISLVASSISGVTLLAIPADVYKYGIGYWFACYAQIMVIIITYFVYLPVFYELEITSIFEYLKIRFNKKLQILASVLFAIGNLLFLPIVIYIPALAFSQATGISVHMITPAVCGICIFYTTIGGLKTVVWTDTLQFFAMIISLIAVFTLGVFSAGGIKNIWDKAGETGRLEISLNLDFTERDTIWSALIGMTMMWLREITINQEFIQKCLSLPTYKDVKLTVWIYAAGKIAMISFSVFTGLIIFAKYWNCDPLTIGAVKRADQLLPYYVMDVAHSIPGLPGLFVAGIFSAALSTLSALMNCLAGTIYNDFMSPFMPKDISQKRVSTILKWLVVIIGIINTALVSVVEKLGDMLALSFSLSGITAGAMTGIFSVGMLIPMVNSTGALSGGIASLLVMAWIVSGRQWYESNGMVKYPTKPFYTNCGQNVTNSTIKNIEFIPTTTPEDVFILYRISFYWYCTIGITITVLVSVIISALTKQSNDRVQRKCISPIARFLLPNEALYSDVRCTIDDALNHRSMK